MEVLSEVRINKWIVPHLSVGKRGPRVHVPAGKVVGALLYKHKTGCQWRLLPVKELLGESGLGWQGVYYHFQRWAQDGSLWNCNVLLEAFFQAALFCWYNSSST